jgi:hypothetical protein
MNWPFHRAVPRYDTPQVPSPTSIPATATPTAEENTMSFLSTVGKDIKGVFSWLGSSKGQAVVAAGETVIETVLPQATAAINLANNWMAEIIKTESLAVAAGSQTGSGATKSAAVISTITPQVLSFAAANGYPVPNATQITTASNALVLFLNTLGASPTPATTPTPAAA